MYMYVCVYVNQLMKYYLPVYVLKIYDICICLSVEGVYCSCTACCGCANVTIPTTATSIANSAFYSCGGGTQLIHVIIST